MINTTTLPYLRTVQRKVVLNPGKPIGRGNLVFLFSKSLDDSIRMMDQTENCYHNGRYKFYYYPLRYLGILNKRRYRINDLPNYEKIKKRIMSETSLRMYANKAGITDAEFRNMYFDLRTYYKIFEERSVKWNAYRRMKFFWEFFTPILTKSYGNLPNKVLLMDANMFPYIQKGPLNERVKNPLYLLYLTLLKKPELVKGLGIDIVIYCNSRVLKINPSMCDEKTPPILLREMKKLYRNANILQPTVEEIKAAEMEYRGGLDDDSTEEETPKEEKLKEERISQKSTQKKVNALIKESIAGADKFGPNVAKVMSAVPMDESTKKAIETKYEQAKKEVEDEVKETGEPVVDMEKAVAEKVEEEINNDEEILKDIYNKMQATSKTKSQRSTARDAMLREQQKDLVVKGLTIKELSKINPKEEEIDENDIEKAVYTTNPNMKKIKFQNFNESYVDKVMPKDMVGVFENLNNASIKMFIRDIKVEDTSDVLNYKETWTVSLEDENRTRHTIKVDIPKFYDKNFLWLSGNKKVIKNQEFFLPVVKISENTVMIVTNYNKMEIQRVDNRSLREITLLEKGIGKKPSILKYFKSGSASIMNKEYITLLEYDEYAKRFLNFKSKKVKLFFNQKEALEIAKDHGVKIPDKTIFIGFKDNNPIFLDIETQRDQDGNGISDIIFEALSKEERDVILKTNIPKRLMYTKITTMKQDVPLIVLMCLWEGISTVLEKAKVAYRIENNTKTKKPNEDVIQFKNCYLIYDTTVAIELLMNGFKVLDTKSYDISEFDTQTPYISFIEKKYGKVSILNALNNVYEFTIGSVEREILINMGLPTDLISLMVYANSLLADSQFVSELDQSEYRIRCAEIIPAILYDSIAKAYVPFKNSNGKKKLSIPQDIVIKKLLALNTVEDYSSLNPFLELETTHGVSTKGWRGVNLEDSYTVPKRSYDKSMTGIIAVSSSPDGQVGVNRSLTMEPTINSARGYLDVKCDNLNDLKDVNLFSPAEMMIPLGVSRDDPIRTGHSVKQSRAMIPVKNASPLLLSNGSDEICKYYLSSDFVVNADHDGKVVELDPETKLMVVEYKDGTHRAINLDKNIVKNGGGGFELSNVLITDLQVGDTFKKNETLAWHKNFFKKIPNQGVRLCVGAMIKVAIYSTYNTYEDADFITEKVADLCSTEMCFRVKVALGRNSNVFRMVSVGDEVAVGDSLIDFDESFEESDINKLLESLGDNEELKEAVTANNRNQKKSKYSGVIEDIKIYSASELEDLSPSLRKIVSKYYKRIDKKHAILDKYDKNNSIVKCGLMVTESSGKTEPDRYGNIRGIRVDDGVAIEFYIKHSEPLEVGSKVANFSPLKNIVSELIPEGYEPRSEYRPEESVDSIISPSSILARMVSSVIPTIFGNKVIVELKRSLQKIWEGPGAITEKRKEMESLIYRFFDAMDKTGANTKKYKDMFHPMSDTKFKSFFTEFFQNPDHYLILDMVDYERDLMIEDIERAAKVIKVPLFEYVTMPHLTMDSDHPIVTKHPIPVGYLHLKRPQQTVMKKNGMSINADQRSAFTGQVTGGDKNGRESDLENCMLTSLGMKYSLKELNGPRADDMVMKREMLQSISTKGYVELGNLTDDLENKTTLNTINTYFYGMCLHTDLVSKGLKLPYSVEKE